MMYPENWPRCPGCDAPALDGHITCGSVECGPEADWRDPATFEPYKNMKLAKETREEIKRGAAAAVRTGHVMRSLLNSDEDV